MNFSVKFSILVIGSFFLFLQGIKSDELDFLRQDPSENPWTWTCENKSCGKVLKTSTTVGTPMEVCKLNCEDNGSLLPIPTGQITIGKEILGLYPAKITFPGVELYPEPLRTMLGQATEIFRKYAYTLHPNYQGTGNDPFGNQGDPWNNNLIVRINITETANIDIKLGTDESYSLSVTKSPDDRTLTAEIYAQTYYGGRHGLETLSQLFAYDERTGSLQVVSSVNITDRPVYAYRGVMLDTSRNYIPIASLKKLIDGLSYNKLNIFHWHITDTHSFPMEVTGLPNMTRYGAYSPSKIYTIEQMKELVTYARIRGVKIIPEFDEPAHVGHGWEWGPLQGKGNLAVCIDKQPWYEFCVEPPCGQLNIVNDNMYEVLGTIFNSMLEIFDNDVFHMGGDEVDFRCYNTTQEITTWMTANNYTRDSEGFLRLWGRFQDKAHQMLVDYSRNKSIQAFMWTSELTDPAHISTYLNSSEYILQIWSGVNDEIIPGLLNNNYRAIFSNYDAMYLDCGFHAWIGDGLNWCSPYKGWQLIYEHSPFRIYENATNTTAANAAMAKGLLLGSETPLWIEQADELSIESRIWPRASAHAERLWAEPSSTWADAEFRMITNRQRYVQRGIRPDRLQPEYCSQNQNRCYGPPPPSDDTGSGTSRMQTASTEVLLLIGVTIFAKIFV